MNLNVYDAGQYPTAYMREHAHAHIHIYIYNIYYAKKVFVRRNKYFENILLFAITNILQ